MNKVKEFLSCFCFMFGFYLVSIGTLVVGAYIIIFLIPNELTALLVILLFTIIWCSTLIALVGQ